MFKDLRKRISNIIFNPAKNAMSFANDFLKFGNKKMGPDWTQVVMDDRDFYTGYSYAAIRNRSNSVARTSIDHLKTEAKSESFVHPYLEVIANSTNFSNYAFWVVISTYLDLVGAYYLLVIRNSDDTKVGTIQEVKLLNPYNIKRVIDKKTQEVTGYIESKNGFIREIPKEMIIEMRELNPFDANKPFAMTDAAKESQFTLKTASDYTRNALKHNINAPGIMTTDVILDDKEFKNFVARVKDHTKGEPVFGNGSGAITYKNMNTDLSKAALKTVNEASRDTLFSVAGVSKTIMGIEQSGTTRDTARIQKDLLVENQTIPRIQLIVDALNLDYRTNHPEEFKKTEANIILQNPLGADFRAEIKGNEAKQGEFDLYTDLLNKGYKADLAAKYVDGEISIDQLGEPTEEPKVVETEETEEKEEECLHCVDLERKKNQLTDESKGVVREQEGALQNAVVNIDQRIVSSSIKKISKSFNNVEFENQEDIIGVRDKRAAERELEAVLIGFYGIITVLSGGQAMDKRSGEFALPGVFKLDKVTKDNIKKMSKKVSKSHVKTVIDDVLVATREEALKGGGLDEITRSIKKKYTNVISTTRAKTIARTETNRAFTQAQFEADRQFIDQNELENRAFKQWRTRSDDPCPFCLELESRGPIPFNESFVALGGEVKAKDKKLPVNFAALDSGNAHPNCSCIYELVIKSADNQIKKETAKLKKVKNDIVKEKKELSKVKGQMKKIGESL